MAAESKGPEPVPPGSTAPWWARALSGAIVGALAGLFLAAIIAVIALLMTMVLPGIGSARIWNAAATVMVLALVVAMVRSTWHGVRRAGRDEPS